MMRWAALIAFLNFAAWATSVHAQSVPAPDPSAAPEIVAPSATSPPVNLLAGHDSALSPSEREAVRRARAWTNQDEPPAAADAGHVIYTFGASLPSIVCAPLRVCDIELEPGETVNDINAGDPVRWKITPASSGAAEGKVTHVIVKPTDTALATNLLITTDRRTYVLKLLSRHYDWMPVVSFSYPDDAHAQWAAYKATAEQEAAARTLAADARLDTLDFAFEVKGAGHGIDWAPVRVYTNGEKTYIEFPAAVSHGDLPALVALEGKTETLVNYRLSGDRFVVDKLLRHAALIRGVGRKQQRVELSYTGKL